MMQFSLVSVDGKTLNTVAGSRAEALDHFSRKLGYVLSENPEDDMTDFMLDEWTENPHWVNPTISVFRKR